jgi:LysM repeat protein
MSAAVWLPDVLSDAFRGMRGFQVDTVDGWRTRSAKTTSFEPRGVINPHTGKGSYANLLKFMTTGSMTAPLCNVATSRPHSIKGIESVRITVCAAGRANHAGKGSLPWTGTDGGNRHSIGIENQNTGSEPWPDQQVEAIRIATAAVLRHLKVDISRMADHKTYAPNRKVDRSGVDLERERAAVRAIIESGVRPPRTHKVVQGDTLFAIGQKFGVRWEEIARINGIEDPRTLSIDQVLKIP